MVARRCARLGLGLAVLAVVLVAASPAAATPGRALLRAADAKDLSQRLRTAGARKVALMLDPEAKPLTGTKAADFQAVTRADARERKSKADATDGVRHDGLVMGATLQAKAKMGVDQFATRAGLLDGSAAGNGAAADSAADSAAGAGGALVPESGSYYPQQQQQRPGSLGARLRSAGLRQAAQGSFADDSAAAAAAADAAPAAAPVPAAVVPVDAFGTGAKSTSATRAIFGFNNLAQGLPGFLSRTLAGRTVTTSV